MNEVAPVDGLRARCRTIRTNGRYKSAASLGPAWEKKHERERRRGFSETEISVQLPLLPLPPFLSFGPFSRILIYSLRAHPNNPDPLTFLACSPASSRIIVDRNKWPWRGASATLWEDTVLRTQGERNYPWSPLIDFPWLYLRYRKIKTSFTRRLLPSVYL